MEVSKPTRYVLIVTYYWPPGSGPGVQRFLKFSKYLRAEGWEPIILSVKNGSYPSFDHSLLDNVPENLRVIKTATFEPFQIYNLLKGQKGKSTGVGGTGLTDPSFSQKLFNYIRANAFIPDARKGWRRFALKEAKKLLKEQEIHAMITTGPPHSSHLIGMELQKKYGIPWVADMRDPWTNIYYNKFFPRTKATELKDSRLETQVVESADAVTVVSNGLKEEFEDRGKRIRIIYNGYDEDDIPKLRTTKNSFFTLSYIGNFKPNQNVTALWEGIAQMTKENVHFKEHLKIKLIGNIDNSILNSIHELGLDAHLALGEFMPHQQAVEQMMLADMLLFVIPQAVGNKLIITGKLFEYLACGNEILAIGPNDGNASALLKEAKRSDMHSYTDVDSIKKQVSECFQLWKDDQRTVYDTETLTQFSRRKLTHNLAQLLNEISHEEN